jgi:hypothetical protein
MNVVQQEAAPQFRGRAFGLVSTLIRTTMVSAVALAPLVAAGSRPWARLPRLALRSAA